MKNAGNTKPLNVPHWPACIHVLYELQKTETGIVEDIDPQLSVPTLELPCPF